MGLGGDRAWPAPTTNAARKAYEDALPLYRHSSAICSGEAQLHHGSRRYCAGPVRTTTTPQGPYEGRHARSIVRSALFSARPGVSNSWL